MALQSVVEVAVHFESFRNIDLFHQGLYHLRARVYREVEGRQVLATPANFLTCQAVEQLSASKAGRLDQHRVLPAHIDEEDCSFATRSFLIRYCEEEVDIDDVAQFRVETGCGWGQDVEDEGPLTLEVDLMFADLTSQGGADRFGDRPTGDLPDFRCVSTQRFRLHEVAHGLHEFCPVVFDEYHFCLASVMVHSALLDVRFRMRPVERLLVERPRAEGDCSPEGEAASPPRSVSAATPSLGSGAAPSRSPSRPGDGEVAAPGCAAAVTFCERLTAGVAGLSSERLLDLAEDLFLKQMNALAESHARLSRWLAHAAEVCMAADEREALGDSVAATALRLPRGVTAVARALDDRGRDAAESANGQLDPRRWVSMSSTWRQEFARRLGSDFSEAKLVAQLTYECVQVSCQVYELWNKALNFVSLACKELAAFLRVSWEERAAELWGEAVRQELMPDDVAQPKEPRIGERHDAAALELRRRRTAGIASGIEDIAAFPSLDRRPLLFEQRYSGKGSYAPLPRTSERRVPSAPKVYHGVHLFVLVHGFQGNSFDMRLMKNNLAVLYPEAVFLCSSSNEENTEGDFTDMGIRLAQEVINYINDWCPGSTLGRLSFVAHSIGGLIVRASLPLLGDYRDKMYTILTLSSPHVGYFLRSTSLFHMGLKVLQSWRRATSLAQLSMADATDPRETFLYRLSQKKGFEWFRNIVLISCPSDQYSPFDSARVEIGGMLDNHSHKEVYCEMVRNVWQSVEPQKVYRFDVNFHIPEKNLDSYIGRTAHIQFLESQAFMKMILHTYSFLFR